MLLALLGHRACQLRYLRHLEPDLVFDNLQQGNIGRSQVARVRHQWSAQRARTGIQLPYTPGDQIDQNVGVANFLQSLFCKFSVQSDYSKVDQNERDKLVI